MIEIRAATDTDVDGLVRVYLDAARHHAAIDPEFYWQPPAEDALVRIRSKLADGDLHVFVAEDGGEIVGMVEVRILKPRDRGAMIRPVSTAELGIAVREDRRDRGIGAALMAHVERWAADNGCERMVLDMSAANDGALRFYERLGYSTFGLLMRKPLYGEGGGDAGERLVDDR